MDRLEEILGSSGKMRMNESATQGTFPAVIFSYDDFDRNGNISPQKIAKFFQWTRVDTIMNPRFILGQYQLYDSTVRLFFSVGEYNVSRSLYKRAVKCRRDMSVLPSSETTQFVSSGKSTLDFFSTITNAEDNEVLATLHFKSTLVDLNTRKSKALPDSLQEILKPYRKSNMVVPRFAPQTRPKGAFSYSAVVRPSDTDFNGHTNQATYISLCFDAATVASMNSKQIFRNFHGEISKYKVRKMWMWYVEESMVGDELTVYLWEDAKDRSLIHFQIDKEGRISYHNSVWFFPETTAML